MRWKAWVRRVPWHNWLFAGFYATTAGQGVSALLSPPQQVAAQAGPVLTLVWAIATIAAGIVGVIGAVIRPDFRWEMFAGVIGVIGVFIYASTVWLLIIVENQPGRTTVAFGIIGHFWPFLIRWMYFHLRESAEIQKRAVIQQVVRGQGPDMGAVSELEH